jgi:hypothetical protein
VGPSGFGARPGCGGSPLGGRTIPFLSHQYRTVLGETLARSAISRSEIPLATQAMISFL